MMNKLKTAKVHMLKFLFLLPLLTILLLAFRDKLKEPNSIIKDYKSKTEVDKVAAENITVTNADPDFSNEATVIKKDTFPQKANSKGFFIDILLTETGITIAFIILFINVKWKKVKI